MNRTTAEDWAPIVETITHGFIPDGGKLAMLKSALDVVGDRLKDGFQFKRVLDIGCGNGRYLIGLESLGRLPDEYVGIDCIGECIAWCAQNLSRPEYQFIHFDTRNEFYNPSGSVPADMGMRLVDEDDQPRRFDTVLLSSVLTHCGTLGAARTLVDMAIWHTAQGGLILTSWFQSPPNQPHTGCDRTVFAESEVNSMLAYEANRVRMVGDYGGQTSGWHDQRVVILERI